MAYKIRFFTKISVFVLLIPLLASCSAVKISQQSAANQLIEQRNNILTTPKLSISTQSALAVAGLNDKRCFEDFNRCLLNVNNTVIDEINKNDLAAYAEIYFAYAEQLEKTDACQWFKTRDPVDEYYQNAPLDDETSLQKRTNSEKCLQQHQLSLQQAVRYSFAYLFFEKLTDTDKYNYIPNELDIQTLDIYNAASNRIILDIYQISKQDTPESLWKNSVFDIQPIKTNTHSHDNDQIAILKAKLLQDTITFYLPDEATFLSTLSSPSSTLSPNQKNHADDASGVIEKINRVENVLVASQLQMSSLNSVSKRQGFGISYVAQLKDRYKINVGNLFERTQTKQEESESARIYQMGNVLLTGFIQPQGNSIDEVLNGHHLDVHLYNPYSAKSVSILEEDYPLAANFSANYAVWLSENQHSSYSYASMLTRTKEVIKPRLFMLEPFNPNKRVIIMVHGLASSPATWVGLTNDVFNDDMLRENYQVWQVSYSTNIPILENRYQIQKLIDETFKQVDPNQSTLASQHSVIIGHSMGAVISRMMVSNNNLLERITETSNYMQVPNGSQDSSNEQTNSLLMDLYASDEVEKRFQLNPIKQVDTAVFVSAPFRGTDYADRWFTRALRRLIHLPENITKTILGNVVSLVSLDGLEDNPLGALFFENGASQLSDKSSFVELTKNIKISDKVAYHSIIASNDVDIVLGIQKQEQLGIDEIDDIEIDLSAEDQDALNDGLEVLGSFDNLDSLEDTDDFEELIFNEIEDDDESLSDEDKKLLAQQVSVDRMLSPKLTEHISDGVVPYTSSHLDGADSETIITGNHGVHDNPKTIVQLRKILHQHLQDYPLQSD